jgi:hypothetical protein
MAIDLLIQEKNKQTSKKCRKKQRGENKGKVNCITHRQGGKRREERKKG